MLINNRRVEAAVNCRALRRSEARGLRILVQAAWDYTMMGLVVAEGGIAPHKVAVAAEEAPHMVAKLVAAGENTLALEADKGQEPEAVEVENEPALEGVEAMETVVEVVKVRVVAEGNNGDKDLEEEAKEMVVVEGALRTEVVMVGAAESKLEMVVVVVRKWAEVAEGKVAVAVAAESKLEMVVEAVRKRALVVEAEAEMNNGDMELVEVVEGNAPGKELEMALVVVVVVVVEVRRSVEAAERETVVVGIVQGKVLAMEGAEVAAHMEGELEAVESKSEVDLEKEAEVSGTLVEGVSGRQVEEAAMAMVVEGYVEDNRQVVAVKVMEEAMVGAVEVNKLVKAVMVMEMGTEMAAEAMEEEGNGEGNRWVVAEMVMEVVESRPVMVMEVATAVVGTPVA
ncbi:hypothetical protein AKJ16_DCAP26595 [Drosera capensis]